MLLIAGFFEDCIAEEQFEAQKLDIMRDAVRAKATYSSGTKQLDDNTPLHESSEPPAASTEPLPTTVPDPTPTISEETDTCTTSAGTAPSDATERVEGLKVVGNVTAASDGSESVKANGESSKVVANGDATSGEVAITENAEGSEVVANGDATSEGEGSKVIENGKGSECIANGSCNNAEGSNVTVPNGIPATV